MEPKKKVDNEKYFTLTRDDSGFKCGKCLSCAKKNIDKNIKMKGGNTTGLRSHLQVFHSKLFEDVCGSIEKKKKIHGQSSLDFFSNVSRYSLFIQ